VKVQHVSKNGLSPAKNALKKSVALSQCSNTIYPARGKVSSFCHEDTLR
jgi:hypothetical protein